MEEEWVEYDGGLTGPVNARRIRVAPGVRVIPEWSFWNCVSLREVDLRNVTTISDHAFNGCSSLERVVWTTASAVEIGDHAFDGCNRLNAIDLSSVTKIGADAFYECEALTHAILSSVPAIEEGAFEHCTNLTEVELGEGIQRIEGRAFGNCSSLVRISIPPSVAAIEDVAFANCMSLAEVELNEGVQRIGEGAFQDCTSLQSIIIPSTTVKIGDEAFASCHQLRYAELPEGLQRIGSQAFYGCSLERVTIPSSVTLIGECAFGDCNNLADVTLLEGLHCIHSEAFEDCAALDHINIPPVAFAIDIERSSCQLTRTTTPKPLGRTIIVSKWMQCRSPDQLEQAEAKVNEILGRNGLTAEEKIQSIREWFAYLDRLDVTTMLELAVWGSNMDENEQNAEARQASRENCGNALDTIIRRVLPFLDERGGSDDDEDA